uniref:Dorsal interacting protein 1, isoform A n=1 Tax=Drosophila melanogaster TaxID=7227 RepID=Q9W381_DROME|eukprot:NP_525004.2 dorsal interacting protein 1, isoform A [Drosophila melanogaster]
MDIFESFCRTCGNECLESLSIYNECAQVLDQMVPIADMLASCLPASLPPLDPEDDYPKQICRICVKKLSMAYEFSHQWLGAHGEFNVALKFEQRRRRSQASKSQSHTQTQTHPVEPKNEQLPTVLAEAVSTKRAATPTNEFSSDSGPAFKCGFCGECFYTEKACKFHLKFSHKDL